MAEALVLELLKSTNRPYNAQGVADMLATKGVKKAAAEKALEALAGRGQLMRKEFGKQKLYWPSQEGLAALSPEEEAAKKAQIAQLQDACRTEEAAVAALKRELADASSSLSAEELQQRVVELEKRQAAQEAKLAGLRSGARRISAEDVAKVEKAYTSMFEAWARYRRQFGSVWDAVSEGLEGKEETYFEEAGIESDKMVGADFEGAKALIQPVKKMRR